MNFIDLLVAEAKIRVSSFNCRIGVFLEIESATYFLDHKWLLLGLLYIDYEGWHNPLPDVKSFVR